MPEILADLPLSITQIADNKFMMVGQGKNRKSMGYVGNIVQLLTQTLDFGSGIHLFNYADKPDMTVKELIETIRSELGMADKPLMKLPYSIGMVGGYTFDVLSRLTGRKFPISSIRIKKFCATTTVSTKVLDSLNFNAPFTLEEGLKLMIRSMVD